MAGKRQGKDRPVLYSEPLADEICERVAAGERLAAIYTAETGPSRVTVLRWLAEHEGFRQSYQLAREARADRYADEIIAIADGAGEDANVQRDRLRVDTRKWAAAKLAPGKYGEKVQTELSGAVTVTHEEALAQLRG
jgi:hypothetical protein